MDIGNHSLSMVLKKKKTESLQWNYNPPGRTSESLQWNVNHPA